MYPENALVLRYLSDPRSFGLNDRQTAKLAKALDRGEARLKLNRNGLLNYLIGTAQRRIESAGPTLYAHNIGSSGSHWLGTMLGQAFGVLPGGEIYLSAKFRAEVAQLDNQEARAFAMQAVMLAHVVQGDDRDLFSSIVNTAHVARIDHYARADRNSRIVFLIRDPEEIVVSRTFRKNEYKAFLGYEDDAEYLSKNIETVRSFYERAQEGPRDLTIRYEDMLSAPEEVLRQIGALLGLTIDEKRIRNAVRRTKMSGGKQVVRTNAYRGPDIDVPPELLQQLKREIEPTRRLLGYAS